MPTAQLGLPPAVGIPCPASDPMNASLFWLSVCVNHCYTPLRHPQLQPSAPQTPQERIWGPSPVVQEGCKQAHCQAPAVEEPLAMGGYHPHWSRTCSVSSPRESSMVPSRAWPCCVSLCSSDTETQWVEVSGALPWDWSPACGVLLQSLANKAPVEMKRRVSSSILKHNQEELLKAECGLWGRDRSRVSQVSTWNTWVMMSWMLHSLRGMCGGSEGSMEKRETPEEEMLCLKWNKRKRSRYQIWISQRKGWGKVNAKVLSHNKIISPYDSVLKQPNRWPDFAFIHPNLTKHIS